MGDRAIIPARGEWSEEEYLALDTNQFIEFSDGYLEFLPMPTIFHQLILKFLCWELDSYVMARNLGTVVPACYPVRLWPGKFRTPDILFMQIEHTSRLGERFSDGADLVMEVVNEAYRAHDIEKKRGEYARAGIPEYWIVDPEEGTITVLMLRPRRKTYAEHGGFAKGARATSKLLQGFSVDVTTAVTQKPEIPA